jgi:predicted nucleic-acid-binding protein
MIGLDTNVLVRYLTQDDPAQTRLANELIDAMIGADQRCYISQTVLVELVWVLRRAYRLPRPAILDTLEKILLARHFEIEGKDAVWRALALLKAYNTDFSDCLISVKHESAGCTETVTFDQKAAALEHMRLLSA